MDTLLPSEQLQRLHISMGLHLTNTFTFNGIDMSTPRWCIGAWNDLAEEHSSTHLSHLASVIVLFRTYAHAYAFPNPWIWLRRFTRQTQLERGLLIHPFILRINQIYLHFRTNNICDLIMQLYKPIMCIAIWSILSSQQEKLGYDLFRMLSRRLVFAVFTTLNGFLCSNKRILP